ncbi:MAG: hypothetical protein EOP84_04065 [Verrucomicrobiaceae bacterium]|nr:MAG: hypothetical protein EOP84_04065 [Verrucomicrobiaceae bacterium]
MISRRTVIVLVATGILAGASLLNWRTHHVASPVDADESIAVKHTGRTRTLPVRPGSSRFTREGEIEGIALNRSKGEIVSSEPPPLLSDAEIDAWLGHAAKGPESAIVSLLQSEHPSKSELLEWVLTVWTVEDMKPASDFVAAYYGEHKDSADSLLIESLIRNWVSESPSEALEWSRHSLPDGWSWVAEKCVAESWAASQPEEVSRWLDDHSGDELQEFWLEEVCRGFSLADPGRGMKELLRFDPQGENRQLRLELLRSWIFGGGEAEADKWVEENPAFFSDLESVKAELDPLHFKPSADLAPRENSDRADHLRIEGH